MAFSIYEATAPVLVRGMKALPHLLDKALGEGKDEAALLEARLAPDMRPLPAQIQMASDTAKFAVARLTGVAGPPMADTEASFEELKARCEKTWSFIEGVPAEAYEGAEDREVTLKFPNGMGYRFSGRDYVTRFVLPNFFFHVTTAYALLRAAGVAIGKPDYLRIGAPIRFD